MRGAIINLAEGMLPIPFVDTNLKQSLQEAVYWLWRVRRILVRLDIEVIGEDENGDPVTVISIHREVPLTVPLGMGTTGSRTEADQLVSRRGYVIDETDDQGTHIIFGFAGDISPQADNFWTCGAGFQMDSSGLSLIRSNPTPTFLPCGTLSIFGEDLVLGNTYDHELILYGRTGVTAFVSITPLTFQSWSGLYEPGNGAFA